MTEFVAAFVCIPPHACGRKRELETCYVGIHSDVSLLSAQSTACYKLSFDGDEDRNNLAFAITRASLDKFRSYFYDIKD